MKKFLAYSAMISGLTCFASLVFAVPTLSGHPPAETFRFVGITILVVFILFLVTLIGAWVWPGKLPQ